jgi:integration host factor subunit beta
LGESGLNRLELIERLSQKLKYISYYDVDQSVKTILKIMARSLANDERIEIRGFGSFTLHHLPARMGRNPKTSETITLPAKSSPHFKPGKILRKLVNEGMDKGRPIRK